MIHIEILHALELTNMKTYRIFTKEFVNSSHIYMIKTCESTKRKRERNTSIKQWQTNNLSFVVVVVVVIIWLKVTVLTAEIVWAMA